MRHLLDKTLTVEREQRTPNGMGGFAQTWVTVATVPARVSPLRGERRVQYQQAGYAVTHSVYLPGGAAIRPGDRLSWGTRVLRVEACLNPSEAGHHLEALCREEE